MKKILLVLFIITIAIVIFFLTKESSITNTNQPEIIIDKETADISINNNTNKSIIFVPPLDRASERITKKRFGDYITPATSPVQPERFAGYHTGVDFEVFEEELETDVYVKAVCSGNLKFKKTADGYGGLAVQSCEINNEAVTVIYGHVNLSSVAKEIEEIIEAGEIFAILGEGNTRETDNERKHLHLGIHKGTEINIKGYVDTESELKDWIDPCLYVCHD